MTSASQAGFLLLEHPGHPDQSVHAPIKRAARAVKRVRVKLKDPARRKAYLNAAGRGAAEGYLKGAAHAAALGAGAMALRGGRMTTAEDLMGGALTGAFFGAPAGALIGAGAEMRRENRKRKRERVKESGVNHLDMARDLRLDLLEHPGHPDQSVHGNRQTTMSGGRITGSMRRRAFVRGAAEGAWAGAKLGAKTAAMGAVTDVAINLALAKVTGGSVGVKQASRLLKSNVPAAKKAVTRAVVSATVLHGMSAAVRGPDDIAGGDLRSRVKDYARYSKIQRMKAERTIRKLPPDQQRAAFENWTRASQREILGGFDATGKLTFTNRGTTRGVGPSYGSLLTGKAQRSKALSHVHPTNAANYLSSGDMAAAFKVGKGIASVTPEGKREELRVTGGAKGLWQGMAAKNATARYDNEIQRRAWGTREYVTRGTQVTKRSGGSGKMMRGHLAAVAREHKGHEKTAKTRLGKAYHAKRAKGALELRAKVRETDMNHLDVARGFRLELLEHPGHPDQSVHSPVKRAGRPTRGSGRTSRVGSMKQGARRVGGRLKPGEHAGNVARIAKGATAGAVQGAVTAAIFAPFTGGLSAASVGRQALAGALVAGGGKAEDIGSQYRSGGRKLRREARGRVTKKAQNRIQKAAARQERRGSAYSTLGTVTRVAGYGTAFGLDRPLRSGIRGAGARVGAARVNRGAAGRRHTATGPTIGLGKGGYWVKESRGDLLEIGVAPWQEGKHKRVGGKFAAKNAGPPGAPAAPIAPTTFTKPTGVATVGPMKPTAMASPAPAPAGPRPGAPPPASAGRGGVRPTKKGGRDAGGKGRPAGMPESKNKGKSRFRAGEKTRWKPGDPVPTGRGGKPMPTKKKPVVKKVVRESTDILEHPGHPDQSVHSPIKRAGRAIRGAGKALGNKPKVRRAKATIRAAGKVRSAGLKASKVGYKAGRTLARSPITAVRTAKKGAGPAVAYASDIKGAAKATKGIKQQAARELNKTKWSELGKTVTRKQSLRQNRANVKAKKRELRKEAGRRERAAWGAALKGQGPRMQKRRVKESAMDLLEAARGFESGMWLLEHPGHADQSVHGSRGTRLKGRIKSAIKYKTLAKQFNPDKTNRGFQAGSMKVGGKKVSAKEYNAATGMKGSVHTAQWRPGAAYQKVVSYTPRGRAEAEVPDYSHRVHRDTKVAVKNENRRRFAKKKA